MMDQFRVCYIPGGMGLDHSAWWLCERRVIDGVGRDWPLRRLRRSNYT